MKYLGKIINAKDYRDDPLNIARIEKLKEAPKNVGDFWELLGFIGHYRQSVKDFSRIAKPLYHLLSKHQDIKNNSRKNSSKKSIGQCSLNELIDWRYPIIKTYLQSLLTKWNHLKLCRSEFLINLFRFIVTPVK